VRFSQVRRPHSVARRIEPRRRPDTVDTGHVAQTQKHPRAVPWPGAALGVSRRKLLMTILQQRRDFARIARIPELLAKTPRRAVHQ
jgi:hypothetical protein